MAVQVPIDNSSQTGKYVEVEMQESIVVAMWTGYSQVCARSLNANTAVIYANKVGI